MAEAKNITDHLNAVHALFSAAITEGQLKHNPLTRIKRSRYHNGISSTAARLYNRTSGCNIRTALSIIAWNFLWIVKSPGLSRHAKWREPANYDAKDVAELYGVPVLRNHDHHGSVKNRASIRDIPSILPAVIFRLMQQRTSGSG